MTQRLNELEAAAKPHNHTSCNLTCLEPDLRLEGYRMALEDVEPVLAVVEAIVSNCDYCIAESKGEGGCPPHRPLRDALKKFRGE